MTMRSGWGARVGAARGRASSLVRGTGRRSAANATRRTTARAAGVVAVALAMTGAGGMTGPAGAADGAAINGVLLTGGSGTVTRAVDVSETGFVAGTSGNTIYTDPATSGAQALRWLVLPNGYTKSQVLKQPAGSLGAQVRDVNELGEVSGQVGQSTGPRALRWGLNSSTWLSGPNSLTVGGGETGWVVQHPGEFIVNTGGFVDRKGTETALNNTPELENTTGVDAIDVIADQTALLRVTRGLGRVAATRYVLYRNGKSQELPTVQGYFFPGGCTSGLLQNGSMLYNGFDIEQRRTTFAVHTGGLGGTNTELPVPAGSFATQDCLATGSSDTLALDGTAGGTLESLDGTQYGDAAVWQHGQITVIKRRDDEWSLRTMAVAAGGRAVLKGLHNEGPASFYYWKAGVRQPLIAPPGWQVADIIALTETGLVVGNVTRGDQVRPIVWRTRS